MPDWQLQFLNKCALIEGAAIGEGAFGPGPAIWVGTREVAHFDSDSILDVRLTKAVIRERRAELRSNNAITLRSSSSDWLEVRLTPDDTELGLALVAEAIAANLSTAPPGLPPTGSGLARRRRFH